MNGRDASVGGGVLVAQVPWPQVEERLNNGATAVLPIGAASKEHGYHLPNQTDFVQAEWLAIELAKRLQVVVWPTLSYGFYPVFVDYPGSISLSRQTFKMVVKEILGGIFRGGAKRAAILNTGISTIAPLRAAIADLPEAGAIDLIDIYSGPKFGEVMAAVEEQGFGGHADEIETSIMLALNPAAVDMARAVAAVTPIKRGMFNRTDPAAANYSPSGANGDPTLASAAKGRRLTEALLEDVLNRLTVLAGR